MVNIKLSLLAILVCAMSPGGLSAQEKLFPVIAHYGGIYDVPEAEVQPTPILDYKIVVDVVSSSPDPSAVNPALNNVARMINLHAIGGASIGRMHVILAVHAGASYALLNDEAYSKKYGVSNPNSGLITELRDARVDITICGQSMISREIEKPDLADGIKVATSMLTTVTTYQTLGYSYLQF